MTRHELTGFTEWSNRTNEAWTGDPLWSVQAYRLALYAIECHAFDRRWHSPLTRAAEADQLTRSIGSVAANIAEGYSRSSLADRVRFYGYALGSAREAIAWYDSLRFELGDATTERQATLIQARRLLLTMLRNTRAPESLKALRDATRPPTTDRGPRSEDRGPRSEDRGPRSEDRGPKTDD